MVDVAQSHELCGDLGGELDLVRGEGAVLSNELGVVVAVELEPDSEEVGELRHVQAAVAVLVADVKEGEIFLHVGPMAHDGDCRDHLVEL